jgi:hypothetical protein
MNIYTLPSWLEFKPTYLYIKRHSVTGLLYFGKTNFFHPEKYNGSGHYWKRHIQKYGKENVETLWYCLFHDREELVKFALMFSEMNNIGSGDLSVWGNLIPENGINGGAPKGANKGCVKSEKTLLKMQKAAVLREINKKIAGYKDSDETRNKKSIASTRTYSQKIKDASSARQKEYFKTHPGYLLGKKQPTLTCPHCGKTGGAGPMTRFHFDNCKQRKI